MHRTTSAPRYSVASRFAQPRRPRRRPGSVARRRIRFDFDWERVEERTLLSTFTVTNTGDLNPDGSVVAGSLRAAIVAANADTDPAGATIDFNITGTGVQTIPLTTALPTITNQVVINGYSQPGAQANTLNNGDNANLLIQLSGPGMNSNVTGLNLTTNGSTVQGLVINQFSIAINVSGNNNQIQGNFVGTDPTGTQDYLPISTAYFNGTPYGVQLSGTGNSIGTGQAAGRNIISGFNYGVVLRGTTQSVVAGNYIGTDVTGTQPLGNWVGIGLLGGANGDRIGVDPNSSSAGDQGNLISANDIGIALGVGDPAPAALNTGIYGNEIGTDVNGTNDHNLGNQWAGVAAMIGSQGCSIGSDSNSALGNTIAFNGGGWAGPIKGPGVWIGPFRAAPTGISVEGNSIHDNAGLGIDIGGNYPSPGPDGVNSLAAPDGLGTGANNLQHYPVLQTAQAGPVTYVSGTLNSNNGALAPTGFASPSGPVLIDYWHLDFYASPAANPTGYGQGERFLGSADVYAPSLFAPPASVLGADGSFTVDLPAPTSPGEVITATATGLNGDTSEFSQAVTAGSAITTGLQDALKPGGGISVPVTTDAQLQNLIDVVNHNLSPVAAPGATLTIDLGAGTYGGQTLSPPAGFTVVITASNGGATFVGHSPALTVSSGQVIVQGGVTLTNSTAAPTILVTGGSLTLRNDLVEESDTSDQAAILITGGTVDLGTPLNPGGNTLDVRGSGFLIDNQTSTAVTAQGNTFEGDTFVSTPTGLTTSPAVWSLIRGPVDLPGYGLDPTFGTQGVTQTPFSNGAGYFGRNFSWEAMAVYPASDTADAGKVVVVGNGDASWTVAQFTANGALDNTFGTNGLLTDNSGDIFHDSPGAVAIQVQPSGPAKIIVAGIVPDANDPTLTHLVLVRYTNTGAPDPSFNGGDSSNTSGRVITDFGQSGSLGWADSLAIAPNGDVVVTWEGPADGNPIVARYHGADGSLDASFGTNGRTDPSAPLPGEFFTGEESHPRTRSMRIQSDGKILIGGDFFGGNPWMQFEIIRLNQDGSPDTSFGTGGNGVVTTSFVPSGFNLSYANRLSSFLTDFTVQDDGKIVAVGYIPFSSGTLERAGIWAIARYNVNVPGQTDGSLDTTFGDGGTINSFSNVGSYPSDGGYPPWFPSSATSSDALVFPTSIVAQNYKLLIAYGNGHLARLNQSDGSLDTTFGDGGLLMYSNIASLIALQGNEIIGVNDGDALTVSRLYVDGHGPEVVSTSSVVAAPAASVFGQSATFTATISVPTGSGTPTGTVQFLVDGAAFGALVFVNQGTASMSTATLPAGTHTVAALYSGDGQFTGSTASTSFVVNPLTTSNLQATLSAPQQGGAVTLQMTSNSDVSTAVAAVNGLVSPGAGATETVTLDLGGGTYTTDTQVSTQPGVTLVIVNGTLVGGSPALIVDAGSVILEQVTALNATNAPTILVNGGRLIVRDSTIEESSGYTQTALWINGGSVDLGTAADPGHNTINVNGTGRLIQNTSGFSVPAVGDVFENNGVTAPSIFVLNPTANGALTLSGSASIKMPGVVIVESGSKTAMSAGGNTQLSAWATGVSVPDPLAGLATPGTSSLTNYGSVSFTTGSHNITQGIYSQIKVSGSASVTMGPGTYIIEGDGLTVTGSASLSGQNVFIYNTGSNYPSAGGSFGGITLSGSGTISLTAPASGPYAGVVIFQSHANTRALAFSGNAMAGISGIIYAPSALLSFSGNSQLQAALDVGMLNLSGNVALTQTASGSDGTGDTSGIANTLLAGDLTVYINDPSGLFTSDELARIQDAINAWDAVLAPYNVTITEVSDPSLANMVIDIGTTSACGGMANGVLGCFNAPNSEITMIQGWNWYGGSDPTQIGSGQYDFQTTVLHELGHALGLGGSTNPSSPMYETLAAGVADRAVTTQDLNIPAPPEGADPQMAAGFDPTSAPLVLSPRGMAAAPGSGPNAGPAGLMLLPPAGAISSSSGQWSEISGQLPLLGGQANPQVGTESSLVVQGRPLAGVPDLMSWVRSESTLLLPQHDSSQSSSDSWVRPVVNRPTGTEHRLRLGETDRSVEPVAIPFRASTDPVVDSALVELVSEMVLMCGRKMAESFSVPVLPVDEFGESEAGEVAKPSDGSWPKPISTDLMSQTEPIRQSASFTARLAVILLAAGFGSLRAIDSTRRNKRARNMRLR
jgi:uncharacterized delta-60 repeat protein